VDERVLVGIDTMDDAAVISIDKKRALIQTVDFFTPVVDDPYMFGQIAAANALSDIYAMGGEPFCAMNIIGFPACLDLWVLEEILRGGGDKVREAGALLVGGHSIETKEPLFGLSVTGIIDKDEVIANSGAKPGDVLVLTKPLGTGIMATAAKGGLLTEKETEHLGQLMAKLNRNAARAMSVAGATGCTDITGFGLIGHACEMAAASSVSLHFDAASIPLIAGVREYAAMGMVPAGSYRNRKHAGRHVEKIGEMDEALEDILYDPQTSGGLLIAVPADKKEVLMAAMAANDEDSAVVIGHVAENDPGRIFIS
jgi:selenide, water dikinase